MVIAGLKYHLKSKYNKFTKDGNEVIATNSFYDQINGEFITTHMLVMDFQTLPVITRTFELYAGMDIFKLKALNNSGNIYTISCL